MYSMVSNTISSIDKWTAPVTQGMPAIATITGLFIATMAICDKESSVSAGVGFVGVSLGALTIYSPKCGRLASSVVILSVAIWVAVTDNS